MNALGRVMFEQNGQPLEKSVSVEVPHHYDRIGTHRHRVPGRRVEENHSAFAGRESGVTGEYSGAASLAPTGQSAQQRARIYAGALPMFLAANGAVERALGLMSCREALPTDALLDALARLFGACLLNEREHLGYQSTRPFFLGSVALAALREVENSYHAIETSHRAGVAITPELRAQLQGELRRLLEIFYATADYLFRDPPVHLELFK